ncbi:hypothetical protein AB8V66_01245 [Listeria ivanovii subsp. ivanovii]|nr:hypothetical protein [Listeria ivanovii]AHI57250.1 hypothetical protein AX25_03820 [Listeria ivanovii WSLC3009]SNV38678.1 Purine nucleoside phosphorylase 1 [Listeria ivanovii subsp. ivanovii]SNV85947.1 Purine nucleoside phosphorylase 1 [Listeria ivanovii subsp. ivanovii]
MSRVIYPVQIMKSIAIHSLIVTNAAGGVNEVFRTGDLMLLTDHINFMRTNPLIGKNIEENGPRFPAMSRSYCDHYIKKPR